MNPPFYDVEDTIAAIASAAGGAARGIIRLSGSDAVNQILPFFVPEHEAPDRSSRAWSRSGIWRLPEPSAPLPCRLYVWPNERSYTRQVTSEIHTLGSPPLLELMVHQLVQTGARLAQPGEFTLRAFLAGRLDLPQAEAVLGVIDAHDRRQLRVALTQLAGGMSSQLQGIRDPLLNLLADVEAGLDFADEDIEFVTSDKLSETLRQVDHSLSDLLRRIGQRSRTELLPRVVLRGRPNAGKSTLWNALQHRDAAIVSDRPGTTRDYLEATLSIGGQRCRLIDSAGVDGRLATEIDAAAQDLSEQVSQNADVVILCLDATRAIERWELAEIWASRRPNLIVLNKCDRSITPFLNSLDPDIQVVQLEASMWLQRMTSHDPIRMVDERRLIRISAASGTGLDDLEWSLESAMQSRSADECELVGATAARCRGSLDQCQLAVRRATSLVNAGLGQELVAAELREGVDQLGLVLGTVYTDDILDRIFSRFCIGK